MVQFRLLFPELQHLKNGARHFSLIGRHLESVISQTKPVFELNLALSKKKPTNEFWSDPGIFSSGYYVNITSCNLCARAKVKGHSDLKIEQSLSLVKSVEGF